jgi:hypothetical protein
LAHLTTNIQSSTPPRQDSFSEIIFQIISSIPWKIISASISQEILTSLTPNSSVNFSIPISNARWVLQSFERSSTPASVKKFSLHLHSTPVWILQ